MLDCNSIYFSFIAKIDIERALGKVKLISVFVSVKFLLTGRKFYIVTQGG